MIVCKSPAEIERMRAANALVAEVLAELAAMVGAGRDDGGPGRGGGAAGARGGRRAGVQGLPRLSGDAVRVGERAGRARDPVESRRCAEGDIVSLDMGVKLNGFYGDSAITVPVGTVADDVQRLLRVTQEALEKGIAQVRLGGRVSDIGHAIQQHVEAARVFGRARVRGARDRRALHEEPQIANYGEPGRGPRLAEGMTLAIEPMVNMGRPAVKVLADGWTAVTRDGSLSAHFEHTVAVTKNGPLVLTRAVRGAGWRAVIVRGSRGYGGRRATTERSGPGSERCRSASKEWCARRCRTRCTGSRSTAAAGDGARAERAGTELHPGAGRRSGAAGAVAAGPDAGRIVEKL